MWATGGRWGGAARGSASAGERGVDGALGGALAYGMTVADMRAIAEDAGDAGASCTSRVGIGLETDRFWDLVASALARLD